MAEEVLIKINIDKEAAQRNAAQLEKAIAKLGVQRSELAKQLKTLTQNEIELDAQRGKALQTLARLEASGKGNTEEAQNLRIEIEKINTSYTDNARKAEAVSAQLNAVKVDITENRKELRLLNREIEAGDNSLEAQRVALIRLQREYDKFGIGVDGTKQDLQQLENEINQLTDSIKQQEEGTQRFQRNVGNYANSIKEALSSVLGIEDITGMLLSAGGGAAALGGAAGAASGGVAALAGSIKALVTGPVALIAALGAGIVQLFNYQQELEATRKQVQLLTGAQDDALDSITASIQATADINNVDFDETLLAANAATQQLGGSLEVNIDLIQKGFAAGANQSGEFLDILREYPTQFQAVGLGLEEMIAISTQNVKSGIFSDKGVDTIKEAGLRLRELTPATRAALDNIGLSSDVIEQKLESGQETLFSTIQKVSARLDELPPQSAEVGTAIADIFGGPGEDAGLQYITTLKDISLNLDEVLEQSGGFADQQYRLTQVNEELNLTFNQLLGGADGFFTEAQIGAKELLNQGIRGLIDGVIGLANYFIDLYNNVLPLRVAVQAVFITVKNVFDSIGFLINQVIDGFKDVGGIIAAVWKGDFAAIPGLIKDAFSGQVENVKQYGRDIGGNFVEGFNDLNKEIDPIKPLSERQVDSETFATGAGQSVGRSYGSGIESGLIEAIKQINVNQAIEDLINKVNPDDIQLEIEEIKLNTQGRISDLENLINQENLLYAQQRAKGIADEQIHQQRLLELQRERLGLEAALLENGSAEKVAKLTQLANVEAEIYEAKQARLNEADAQRDEFNAQREAEQQQKREENAARQAAIEQRNQESLNTFVSNTRAASEAIIELTRERTDQEREASAERKRAFQEGSTAYKAAVIAQKTAALAEIAINLQREISSYWATSAAAGPAAPAVAIPLTVAAIARAAGATATILRFAEGGTLSEGQSGLAIGPTHNEGGIWATNNNRLINFEGNEFIVRGSAAMNNLPALQAINAYGDKIRYNASRDKFAVGGSLSGQIASTQVTNQIIQQFNLSQVMKDIIGSIPPPVLTVEAYEAVASAKNNVEVRANQ